MSDARWLDVEDDVASAIRHFSRSVEIFEHDGFAGNDLAAYMARMSLMQAMQSGYTSLDAAFERILEVLWRGKADRRQLSCRSGPSCQPRHSRRSA